MAKIECNAIQTQCLDRRISDTEPLDREVDVWVDDRNASKTWFDWRFTTDEARIKLQRLNPKIED